MIQEIGKVIVIMACLRFLSGTLEIVAGFFILKFNQVEKALVINSLLALIGPLILISSLTLGLIHLADKLSFSKLALIGLGVALIIWGIRK